MPHEEVTIGDARLILGDCREVLPLLPKVDACVTDPPYGLSFMGKKWDYDVPAVEIWAECLRALKPGGHLLAFAGTRTQHRMAVRIEDAGFEIRDMIAWVYGSGFPKSLDVSKAIDKAAGAAREKTTPRGAIGTNKTRVSQGYRPNEVRQSWNDAGAVTDAAKQWAGWGTALKPALEPITVARKPLDGTVAANVLKHGTGALNIDGCRVGDFQNTTPSGVDRRNAKLAEFGYRPGAYQMGEKTPQGAPGRWPANLIHDGSGEVLLAFPDAPGQIADVSVSAPSQRSSNIYGAMRRGGEPSANSDNNGAVGFKMKPGARRLDAGSAARFFYCAKASKADRDDGNDHPTVKPTDLMRYLVRLVTPPGGTALDPFMGTGSTGKAAMLEGLRFIGIERERRYFDLACERIARAQAQGSLLPPEAPPKPVQEPLVLP